LLALAADSGRSSKISHRFARHLQELRPGGGVAGSRLQFSEGSGAELRVLEMRRRCAGGERLLDNAFKYTRAGTVT